MHTLFVREHNRLAERFAMDRPALTEEVIYRPSRRLVIGEMQVITYREFLPMLLGFKALSSTLLRVDANGDEDRCGTPRAS